MRLIEGGGGETLRERLVCLKGNGEGERWVVFATRGGGLPWVIQRYSRTLEMHVSTITAVIINATNVSNAKNTTYMYNAYSRQSIYRQCIYIVGKDAAGSKKLNSANAF